LRCERYFICIISWGLGEEREKKAIPEAVGGHHSFFFLLVLPRVTGNTHKPITEKYPK
jgi:hypothetical protein